MDRNPRHIIDYAPQSARPCECDGDEPFGDRREGTCCKCGRQVDGRPLPARVMAFSPIRSGVRPATKRRRYSPAP